MNEEELNILNNKTKSYTCGKQGIKGIEYRFNICIK